MKAFKLNEDHPAAEWARTIKLHGRPRRLVVLVAAGDPIQLDVAERMFLHRELDAGVLLPVASTPLRRNPLSSK